MPRPSESSTDEVGDGSSGTTTTTETGAELASTGPDATSAPAAPTTGADGSGEGSGGGTHDIRDVGATSGADTSGDPALCTNAALDTGLVAGDLEVGDCMPAPLLLGVYVLRDGVGYYAMASECTHNGCKVHCPDELGVMKCPCHGSRFDRNGEVLKGPAPIHLDHFPLSFCGRGRASRIFADPGQVLVDRDTRGLPD